MAKLLRVTGVSAFLITVVLGLTSGTVLAADPPQIDWVQGPSTVGLGDVAQVNLNQNHIFANAADTQAMMKYLGEPTDKSLVGLITSAYENDYWYVLFANNPIGYVRDDEKDSLDAAAILESIRQGTIEGNKVRVKNNVSTLTVTGWYEEPHYDTATHNLVWAILVRDDGDGTVGVNYNTRLLGRYGYMSVNLVTSPETLETDKNHLTNIISNYSWKAGKSYAEWVSGDKVATVGLTALIAGGAGAAAASTGLLAKIWKFLVAGVIAIGAAIARFFKKIFGKKDKGEPPTYTIQGPPPSTNS